MISIQVIAHHFDGFQFDELFRQSFLDVVVLGTLQLVTSGFHSLTMRLHSTLRFGSLGTEIVLDVRHLPQLLFHIRHLAHVVHLRGELIDLFQYRFFFSLTPQERDVIFQLAFQIVLSRDDLLFRLELFASCL